MSPYQKLLQRRREVAYLSSSASLLGWDQETGLPERAHAYRAEQLAYLAGLAHRLSTAPEVGRWISECEEKSFAPGSLEADNLRGWRRDYDQAAKLPSEHVEEVERQRSLALNAWRDARAAKDFPAFEPFLRRNFELARKTADYLGWKDTPYDALLDSYEEGARTADIAPVLARLAQDVAALLPSAIEQSAGVDRNILRGDHPVERQKAFNRCVAEALGYDFSRGRIDTVTHPFCTTLGPDDIRLTTRYDPQDFAVSFFGVLHEAGHGLYEQGLPTAEFGQPAGSAVSLGIHESQSRTWENKIGRSREFWEHWYPIACDTFPDLRRHGFETFLRAINAVRPSFIRVEADEVTYDLHVALRFEIERALIEGTLAFADVPARWNERFHELTGLKVPDDSQGCLQDVHWAHGLIGYFPTYSLGNLASSQLFAKFAQENPGWQAEVRTGSGASILSWMRDRIHRHGRRLTPDQLLRAATGEPLNAAHHITYLRGKFAG